MDCQICNFKDLPQGVEVCPQCDSDLKSFILLESIENVNKPPKNKNYIWYILLFMILSFSISGYLYYDVNFQNEQLETINNNSTKEVLKLSKEIETKEVVINRQKALIDEISNETKYQWITITIRKGDDLYTLIERIASDLEKEQRIKMICKKNNINDIDFILEGEKIQIIY